MADQILPEGIRFFPKHQNQPDFVLGAMVISLNELFAWAKAHPELQTEYNGAKQIKLQLLNSKAGKMYAAVDTYKAEPKTEKPVDTGNDLPF